MNNNNSIPQKGVTKKVTKKALYKDVVPYLDGICSIGDNVKPEQVAYDLHRSILGLDKQGKMRPVSDLAIFLLFCREMGLRPMRRQVWATYPWNSTTGREELTPITSIHGLRSLARKNSDNPKYAYTGEAEIKMKSADSRIPYSVKMPVYGFFNGENEPKLVTTYEALYDEFVGLKKDGTPNAKWSKSPVMMLSKCAEANAIRKGFELDGVYVEEEMPENLTANPSADVIDGEEVVE